MTKIGTLINNDHCIVIFIIDTRIFVLKIASTNKGKKGTIPSNIIPLKTNYLLNCLTTAVIIASKLTHIRNIVPIKNSVFQKPLTAATV